MIFTGNQAGSRKTDSQRFSGVRDEGGKASVRRLVIILAALMMLATLCGNFGAAEAAVPDEMIPFSRDPAAMEKAAASVVRLEVFNGRGEQIGSGSGFAAFEPAVLVTAAHVIVNMEYMIATRDDGATFQIEKAFGSDTGADIALCALPEDAGVPPLQWAAGEPARGEAVVAIGSQFGLINLVTVGNVCGRWDAGGIRWILFTAPVSGGSSGGPLLNDEGLVTGVITGTYDKGQNLNLAVPYETVAALMGTNDNRGGTLK